MDRSLSTAARFGGIHLGRPARVCGGRTVRHSFPKRPQPRQLRAGPGKRTHAKHNGAPPRQPPLAKPPSICTRPGPPAPLRRWASRAERAPHPGLPASDFLCPQDRNGSEPIRHPAHADPARPASVLHVPPEHHLGVAGQSRSPREGSAGQPIRAYSNRQVHGVRRPPHQASGRGARIFRAPRPASACEASLGEQP